MAAMDIIYNWPTSFISQNAITLVFIHFFLVSFVSSINFQIPRFDPDLTNVLYIGDAVASVGEVEMTNIAYSCRVGQVLYAERVPIWDSSSRKLADFSTRFSFTVDTRNLSEYGHGLAFFLAPAGFQIPLNSNGGFLGLVNNSNDESGSRIVAVEFDSYLNGWDPRYQHVGINKDSISSAVTAAWNASLHSLEPADVWITYNATAKNLSVYWSYRGSTNSSLSYTIDLMEVLPQWVTIGFSAATGINYERHILQSWEFSSNLDIEERPGDAASKTGLIIGLTVSGVLLVSGGIVVFAIVRKRRKIQKKAPEAEHLTSINDDLEKGAGPRRFGYKDLALATNNFSDDRKLGEGGFGGVYRGYLVDLDMPIAVKKFSRHSKQGKKEYTTEVKVISQLRHRNLVQLIGWCHDEGEFLLVYEFMPNGSLDFYLFGKKNPLNWDVRYKIALGLASAVLYLHEECEQCVVHRDIKSSNIMLDTNYNVKLGDFGLAKLMDHELGPQTTGLAGTLGYLAPEYVRTGRASKESDVYSFGVVALEIGTGKKPADPKLERSQTGLVEWVWDLYGKGELVSAMDERLNIEFDQKQAERLMIVGLWCAYPDNSQRPSIRQAIQVLNLEAALPNLPTKMPVPMYKALSTSPVSSGEPLITHTIIQVGGR